MTDEASKFRGYATFFTLLTLLGAVGLGWVTSQETTCSTFLNSVSCETETDAPTFWIVAGSTFVGGLLFVIPLRALALLLEAMARIVPDD